MKCKDNTSRYVAVPSGRKHFFGELKERRQLMETAPLFFVTREFQFPKNIEWYLTYMYGNYMELPPESAREYHVVYRLKL
jgi:lipopolysaccharide cholinephosphotransferase